MTGATVEAHNAFAGQGAVLLDVGGDVGALVVTMPDAMSGVEVEIRPAHRHAAEGHCHDPHVAVVLRPVAGGVLPSLVFADVVEGDYVLAIKGEATSRLAVSVRGGQVVEATWPRDGTAPHPR